ncbi:isoamylase early set domain-containing protein [Aestuariibacter halophilus]|uniref:Isoamylase early set domain-containing protein n=1 Tax=Fluctibacter halophilus TaxID=226011 RepID=A0ABS8G4L4_9ALTE|nr:isoamylase early set domain-containing protein [Aestuariibacter halophilus]MCC2615378.1 isoamylase early set domain-containing protein [Aestuariibacter halophilus]
MSVKKQYLKSRPVCKVTFKLSAQEAQQADSVKLVGDFNDWNSNTAPMKKLKNGAFTSTVELPKDNEYQFRYLLNDSAWENDWSADDYVPSGVGNEDNSLIRV